MILLLLAYLGGVLTILSPCILPVLPFVFARADRPFLTQRPADALRHGGDFAARGDAGGGRRRLGGRGERSTAATSPLALLAHFRRDAAVFRTWPTV